MRNDQNKETLSSLHRKKLQDFDDDECNLETYENECKLLENQARELKLTDPGTFKEMMLDINEKKKKIERIKTERMNYVLKNGILLYNFTESEKDKRNKIHGLEILKQKKNIVTDDNIDTSRFYRKFRSNIDPDYVYAPENNINEDNYCYECNEFKILNPDEAIMICELCGKKTTIVTNPEKPSMKDPPAENKYYEYKRYTHFCDWLSNLQGKESSRVPDEVINVVIREITREKMEDRIDELSESDIRRYLKKYSKINYDRYYDHSTQILFRITEIPPIQMTPEMEQNLKLMFLEIQEPFELYKGDRRNFSSYSYMIYKFCQLLDYVEFLPKLKLHKNKTKLYEHDRIWKKICNHVGGEEKGWKFIKSYEY
jgi:hypothetical protein